MHEVIYFNGFPNDPNDSLNATHFVWLEGQAGLDITDQHIDGFARFGNSNTIVTMENDDLLAYDV